MIVQAKCCFFTVPMIQTDVPDNVDILELPMNSISVSFNLKQIHSFQIWTPFDGLFQ